MQATGAVRCRNQGRRSGRGRSRPTGTRRSSGGVGSFLLISLMPAPKRAMKPQARMMPPAAPSTTPRPTTTSKAASMSHGHAEFLRTVTTTSRLGSLPRVGSLRRPYTARCAVQPRAAPSSSNTVDGTLGVRVGSVYRRSLPWGETMLKQLARRMRRPKAPRPPVYVGSYEDKLSRLRSMHVDPDEDRATREDQEAEKAARRPPPSA